MYLPLWVGLTRISTVTVLPTLRSPNRHVTVRPALLKLPGTCLLVLTPGESALFYSDGLVEAHDPEGEMFGFPRLQGLVSVHANDRSLVDFQMKERYAVTWETWEQEEDDIPLLTLRWTA
jgi:Stage II sporulation protein E (SpoIIE)